jgi:hypothetical protein
MDQSPLVNDRIDRGNLLIEKLDQVPLDMVTAFWVKPAEEPRWYLYLCSPYVKEHGALAGYRLVNRVLRESPELGIDSSEVRLLSPDDSLAQAALNISHPKSATTSAAGPFRWPFSGISMLGPAFLADVEIDEAYFYPPRETNVPA